MKNRETAEERLQNMEAGTFLSRWSANSRSYVVSYKTQEGRVAHVAGIFPAEGESIDVELTGGNIIRMSGILEFINRRRTELCLNKAIVTVFDVEYNTKL